MAKLLLALALFVSATLAAPTMNVCRSSTSVVRPSNSVYYWPATWNENQTAPALEKQQNCKWTVSVPTGSYAKLIMSGKINDKESRFETIDAVGNLIQSTHEKMEPYYFPGQKFTIVVSNEASATFAFKIVWGQLPQVDSINGVGSIQRFINSTSRGAPFASQYDASTGLALISFPVDPKHYISLRSTLVFEGSTTSGNYLGSLALLYKTQQSQWIFPSAVVICNVEDSHVLDTLLIMDAQFVKDFAQYKEVVPSGNGTYSVSINGGVQQSAFVTYATTNQTITDIQADNVSTISTYYGTPSPFNRIQTYTVTTFKQALPMTIDPYVFNLVLKSGKATFTFQN